MNRDLLSEFDLRVQRIMTSGRDAAGYFSSVFQMLELKLDMCQYMVKA